jgi:hypothetical protein
MNEDLLYALRQPPDPAFARTLEGRLRNGDNVSRARRAWPTLRRLAMAAAVVLVIAGLFSVRSVRAYADSFLALFRVVNFVAVPVSSNTVATLTNEQLDLPRLIGEQVQVLQEPGAPLPVVSVADASSVAGFQVLQPLYMPTGMTLDGMVVKGAGAARVVIDAARVNDVLHALSITDIEIPPELTGQTAYVSTSPMVRIDYRTSTGIPVSLMQAKPPQVQLPASLDLARLGEIALRVLGMPADDAHRFAQSIDWSTTLLVPIPPGATAFQQLNVNGHQGLMVERQAVRNSAGAITAKPEMMILWSTGDRVFGLTGGATGDSARQMLQQMAASIR